MKDKLHQASARYKTMVKKETEDVEQKRRDRDIGILKQQVLDLNDKFDYFVCMMLKGQKLPVENMAPPQPKENPGQFERMKSAEFGQSEDLEEDLEIERQELIGQF